MGKMTVQGIISNRLDGIELVAWHYLRIQCRLLRPIHQELQAYVFCQHFNKTVIRVNVIRTVFALRDKNRHFRTAILVCNRDLKRLLNYISLIGK